jgi:hypothetical protein
MPDIKKCIIVITFFAISFSIFAQKQLITFSPMGFVDKLRVKYERSSSDNVSLGSFINIYYAGFKGIRLDPFIRFYPAGKAPKGFYIQAKAIVGVFYSKIEYDFDQIVGTDTTTLVSNKSETFLTYGAGLGLGHQFLMGKSEVPLDIFLGFQYSKFGAPESVIIDNNRYETMDDAVWYMTGPGSILNMNFGIGFSF